MIVGDDGYRCGSVRSNYPSFLEVPSDPSDVQDGSLRV